MDERKPFKCFDLRFLAKVLAATMVFLILAFAAAKRFAVASPARIALVGIGSAVMAYVIAITVLTIRRLDELNQRIHLVAIAGAFAVTGAVGTGLGLLEHAGLAVAGWEEYLWVFMVMVWSLGVVVVQRRYR